MSSSKPTPASTAPAASLPELPALATPNAPTSTIALSTGGQEYVMPIHVVGPEKMIFYMVTAADLEALQSAGGKESIWNAAFFGCVGIFAGGALGLLAAGKLEWWRYAIYIPTLILFLVLAIICLALWVQAIGSRKRALLKITNERNRTTPTLAP